MPKKFPKLPMKGGGEKKIIPIEKKVKKKIMWGTINDVRLTQHGINRESLSASSHSSIIKSHL